MNLIYFSLIFALNIFIHILPVYSAPKDKQKYPDVIVNGDCANFDEIEKNCRDQAESKYGDANKNGRNQCCVLMLEIECLKPYVKVCSQTSFLVKITKRILSEKMEFRDLQCGGYQYNCPEESFNIWLMVFAIFTASIVVASVCIICVTYIKPF